jgi:hypothetical protein
MDDTLQFSGQGDGFNLSQQTEQDRVGVLRSDDGSLWCGIGPLMTGDSGGPIADTTAGGAAVGMANDIDEETCPGPGDVSGVTVLSLLQQARQYGLPIRLWTVKS